MRARDKLDKWIGHGWAIIQAMGAHLLEHPEEFSMLDLGQLELVTRFFAQGALPRARGQG